MKALIAAALLTTAASQALAADPTTLCNRLAAQARTVKDSAWGDQPEKALAPALQIDALNGNPPPFEKTLAALPEVRKAIGDETGQWTVFTDHLPGTDVYSASTLQGTLDCQSSVFLKAKSGAPPTIITAPATSEAGEGLCWTQSGDFGRLYGQPAFFAHGAINDHSFDATIAVTPWTNDAWARGCEVDLTFRTRQRLVERHCEDEGLCRAGQDAAMAAAAAYNAYRMNDAANIKAETHFRFGPAAPAAVEAAAQRWAKASDGGARPDVIPGGLSSSGLEIFPISLNGQWLMAAIGHAGVGWRESRRTLLEVYADQAGALTPKADFVFDAVNDGLAKAAVKALGKPAA